MKLKAYFWQDITTMTHALESLRGLTAVLSCYANSMWHKLKSKALEGYNGWNEPEYFVNDWKDHLVDHVARIGKCSGTVAEQENLVDIGNIAMFGFHHLEDVGCWGPDELRNALRTHDEVTEALEPDKATTLSDEEKVEKIVAQMHETAAKSKPSHEVSHLKVLITRLENVICD